jgi:hypothetical protein
MAIKCVACGGTGKSVAKNGPGNTSVILDECKICLGKGLISQGMLDALKGAQQAMIDAAGGFSASTHAGGGKDDKQAAGGLEAVKTKKVKAKIAPALPVAGTGVGEVMSGIGGQVAAAFIEAGKQKVATEVMHGMVGITKDTLGKMGFQLPPSPVVDKALAIGMPVLIMLAAQTVAAQAPEALPKALLDNLNAAATYALQGISKETVNELAQVALPFAMQIAALGAGALGQLHAGSGQQMLPEGMLNPTETTT